MRHPIAHKTWLPLLGLLVMTGGFHSPILLANSSPPREVVLQPSALANLVTRLGTQDEPLQRAFAIISLEELSLDYRNELQTSGQNTPLTSDRRLKLARWRRATADLISQLEFLRTKLQTGAPFTLHLERQQEVLIIVDRQPVVVSGPRVTAMSELEGNIVRRFCSVNDCSWLEDGTIETRNSAPSIPPGIWVFSDQRRPRYEIGDQLSFEFDDLADRQHKAQSCKNLTSELEQLSSALETATIQGYQIDWDWLSQHPPTTDLEHHVILNTAGSYLRLHLPLTVKLVFADWQRVAHWLRQRHANENPELHIKHAEMVVVEPR